MCGSNFYGSDVIYCYQSKQQQIKEKCLNELSCTYYFYAGRTCLASYLGDSEKFSMFFSVVFQASTGKKLWGKITEKITEPGNLMLNILLMYFNCCVSKCFQGSSNFVKFCGMLKFYLFKCFAAQTSQLALQKISTVVFRFKHVQFKQDFFILSKTSLFSK